MIVFSDTTPILALSSIDQLDLLPTLFNEIHVVREVVAECAIGGKIIVPDLTQLDWVNVVESENEKWQNPFLNALDKGEKHTLNMAIHKNADHVIIDEKIARNVAEYMGLSVTGTLGVLLKAKQQGKIASFSKYALAMQEQGIYYNTALLKRLALNIGEDFNSK
jgi:predicted nucleic acid-binding protein